VYVYRSEAGKTACTRGEACSQLVPRLWSGSGFEHSILDAPGLGAGLGATGDACTGPSGSEALRGLGTAVALAGFRALYGAPSTGDGTLLGVDMGYTYLSLDPIQVGDPASQTPSSARAHFASRSLLRGPALTVSEGVGGRQPKSEVAVPIFRLGLHPAGALDGSYPAGTPQANLAGAILHIAFGTVDVSARSVSARVGAACALLLPAARGKAGCGDYVSQAGLVTFPPNARRRDVLLSIVNDLCAEAEAETLVLQLYLPGGARVRGYGYTATVTIDDDDITPGAGTGGVPGPSGFDSPQQQTQADLC
jgi:hypothetical protein